MNGTTDRTADGSGAVRCGRRRRRAGVALAFVLAAALSGTLAACGKRGPVEPPPGSKETFPRTYPDPSTY